MISQINWIVTGVLCFLLFILNVTVSHSLSNVTTSGKNEDQVNQCENWLLTCKNGLEIKPAYGGSEHSEKVIEAVNSLNRRLDDLEKKIQEGIKLRILDEIIEHVKRGRFCVAEYELSQYTDDNSTYIYDQVVQQVYNNSITHFDVLLQFSDSIKNVERKIKIYNSLYKETASSALNDTGKLLRFSESIKKEIIDPFLGSLTAKTPYQDLENAIRQTVVKPITSLLFQNDDWKLWRKAFRSISTVINNECQECMLSIYTLVVRAVWNKIPLVDFLNQTEENMQYFDEQMAVHIAVADMLERTQTFRTSSAMTLARKMKRVMDYINYEKLDADLRSRYLEAKNKLPKSVKTLIFSQTVCIKSIHSQEYLYASDDFSLDDFNPESGNRRNVYTSKIANSCESCKFRWRVKFVADNFTVQLQNIMKDEDLYSEPTNIFDTRRKVFTSKNQLLANQSTYEKTYWTVETEGDFIHLINVHNNEYLLPDLKYDVRGKLMHTARKWEIVDCSYQFQGT